MAFRDDAQRNAAISALLARTVGPGFWSDSGPTLAARKRFSPIEGEDAVDEVGIMIGTVYATMGLTTSSVADELSLGDVMSIPDAWRTEAFLLLGAHAEGAAAVDRWLLAHALEISGSRLRAMRVADPARWHALLRQGIGIATSKPELARVLGVDLKTAYLWLDEAKLRKEANERFRMVRDAHKRGIPPMSADQTKKMNAYAKRATQKLVDDFLSKGPSK